MKTFIETIYFHREKEDNWEFCDIAEEKGFKNPDDMVWVGSEVEMKVEISESNKHKVLEINGIDISDKEVFI